MLFFFIPALIITRVRLWLILLSAILLVSTLLWSLVPILRRPVLVVPVLIWILIWIPVLLIWVLRPVWLIKIIWPWLILPTSVLLRLSLPLLGILVPVLWRTLVISALIWIL